MIPCCNDASSVDTSKWCNANLISLHFCAAFWEHFYSFSNCTAGTKEQKNILTLVLQYISTHMVIGQWSWSSSIPLSPKCHNNYHVEMQTKKLKCCQWKYLYSSLKFGMNSFYQKQLSEWAMGDPTKKMCPFLLPFICIGSGGQTLVWNFPHFFWRVPLDSIRYDLMEIYCVLVSNFIFFEVY